MKIREADIADIPSLSKLFIETVSTINLQDYSVEQVQQWANCGINHDRWLERLEKFDYYVCVIDKSIVGFASINEVGFINAMFVSKDHQRRGVAQFLFDHLLKIAQSNNVITMDAEVSITALPFFIKNGFSIVKEQIIILNDARLKNCVMTKTMS